MKSIFILNSPLQYLNAIEAIKYFKTNETTLLLKDSGSILNQEQIKNLNLKFGYLFNSTYKIKHQNGLIYNLDPYTKKLLPIFNDIDMFFSGSIGEGLNQYLMNVLNPKKVIYLDDGTKTLRFIERENRFKIKNWIKKLLISKNYIDYTIINYFTAYYQSQWPEEYNVIPNDYNYLSSFVRNDFALDDCCYFLISPVVEKGRIEPLDFKKITDNIIDIYGGNIKFILHRYSDVTLMRKLLKVSNKNIIQYENIIEVELINRKIYPKKIASFISSALLNLSFIFKDANFKCFMLPDYSKDENDSSKMSKYFKLLKANSVELIKV
jgi:hypothetical protein